MNDLNNVARVIWRAGPNINERHTRPSSSVILPLSFDCRFSDWDVIVVVIHVMHEDVVKALPLDVSEFQRAVSQARPITLEPAAGPSAPATRISYESDTEFKFLSAPEGYGLQHIFGITKVGSEDMIKNELFMAGTVKNERSPAMDKKIELLLTAIGGG